MLQPHPRLSGCGAFLCPPSARGCFNCRMGAVQCDNGVERNTGKGAAVAEKKTYEAAQRDFWRRSAPGHRAPGATRGMQSRGATSAGRPAHSGQKNRTGQRGAAARRQCNEGQAQNRVVPAAMPLTPAMPRRRPLCAVMSMPSRATISRGAVPRSRRCAPAFPSSAPSSHRALRTTPPCATCSPVWARRA